MTTAISHRYGPLLVAATSILNFSSVSTAFLHRPTIACQAPFNAMGKKVTGLAGARSSASNVTDAVAASKTTKTDPHLPTMIVFDLDDCLWSPEMYTLRNKPSIPIEGDLGLPTGERGVIGMQVPNGPIVRLFDGARKALRELATNPKYQGILLAAASSSEEPAYSYACFENIEILPGVTMRQMFAYDQIGRTGQLSSRKTTHFALIQKESGVPFEEMVFFDDCNWGDHVADIYNTFNVVGQRTPRGLTFSEFEEGLKKYRAVSEQRAECQ